MKAFSNLFTQRNQVKSIIKAQSVRGVLTAVNIVVQCFRNVKSSLISSGIHSLEYVVIHPFINRMLFLFSVRLCSACLVPVVDAVVQVLTLPLRGFRWALGGSFRDEPGL